MIVGEGGERDTKSKSPLEKDPFSTNPNYGYNRGFRKFNAKSILSRIMNIEGLLKGALLHGPWLIAMPVFGPLQRLGIRARFTSSSACQNGFSGGC